MADKLTPKQQELLEAMRSGVEVHYLRGVEAYYFRSDTMRRCSSQARGLYDKGYATITGSYHVRLVLTEKGKA